MSAPTAQRFSLAISQALTLGFTLDTAPSASVAGWTLAFYLRRHRTLMFTKTTGDGITCTDPDAGAWDVALDAADTTDAAGIASRPGLYDWTLWRTDDGSETPLALGTCQVYRTARTG